MKHFAFPLYYYNGYAEGMASVRTFEKMNAYWSEYHRVVKIMLDRCEKSVLSKYRKQYYLNLSAFYTLKMQLMGSQYFADGKKREESLRQDFLRYVRHWLGVKVEYDDLCEKTQYACRAAELALSGIWRDYSVIARDCKRIIGYGALGKRAAKLLPLFNDTVLQPTELWDKAGDGRTVQKPDFASLTENDLLICLPTTKAVVDDVKTQMLKSNAKALYGHDIADFFAQTQFPQFEDVILR
jgi:hypothetical protein